MAKDFTEVKDFKKTLEALYRLKDLEAPLRGRSYTKEAPLEVVLFGEQKGNIITLTVNVLNPNAFEWFLKKRDDRFIEVYDEHRNYVGNYPAGGNSPGIAAYPSPPHDHDYWLLDPQETLMFKVEIKARDFYDIWKKEPMYLQYIVDTDLPPSLRYWQKLVDPENYYTALAKSNRVRIRCSEYIETEDLYPCKVENLPFGQ